MSFIDPNRKPQRRAPGATAKQPARKVPALPPPDAVRSVDRGRLIRLRARLRQAPEAQAESLRAQFVELAAQSARTVQQRRARLPVPRFDDSLPIPAQGARIGELLRAHRVVIVAGETGSGKTTQLPKLALAAGRGACGLIGCTQPRRIAARSVARRVAGELDTPLGELVGYQVRFDDRAGDQGAIKF